MDITTVSVGRATRNRLRQFRDAHEFDNYDEALQALLNSPRDRHAFDDTAR